MLKNRFEISFLYLQNNVVVCIKHWGGRNACATETEIL